VKVGIFGWEEEKIENENIKHHRKWEEIKGFLLKHCIFKFTTLPSCCQSIESDDQ
jgi:hypothetical protein